ncbi:CypX Cytochrome P450 [Pyrenophora tritici-repentis]|uniref:Cytochrome P450 n=2 Tax=Pyrenophora tritici-repentis TaxID=45151 RepID=A0A2W1FVN9_9PLEO|nr:O-methylsterigmatocystin oxidoreductase [Pyrenophora tritici-repentis Pt-1C-BFP]KAF7451674.1 CypX Cytochrome P450 [Pyrenophora tritici-repentis]EDU45739.1 O-methylsterigmatocystin oxidoreductase [Pyrenophora tritici-repentis Pt-1C-BFP]KAF7575213.1 CypX, Cytochrome P450 [Pyrenophora tritici-repentis]KAI0573503.1 CypX Cytochrome P450 [Pyrenophora tritici-repentis]KAI0577376.1 CypX cytochrome P450 [Pyrenophora tritici-repentis]
MTVLDTLPSLLVSSFTAKVAAVLAIPFFLLTITYIIVVPNILKDPRRRHLPPGPLGLPFIGSLLELSDTELVRHKVQAWHRKYGDVFHTKIGATDYIWLSSPQAVKDLMDKRSSIYSSRPPSPLAQDVASAGRRQLFMPYGPRWRSIRKHSHALLNLGSSIKYQPVQDYESKILLTQLLQDPDSFASINRRYAASVIMQVTYGQRIADWDAPLIKRIYDVLERFTEMTAPGAWAIESFPFLASLPQGLLGNWRAHGERIHVLDKAVYMDLWTELKRATDAGTAKDCFTKKFYLDDPASAGIDDLSAAYTCGGLIEAGSETTGTVLNNFLLAMVLFPETQRVAQEELDRVVGPGRLPEWEDEEHLPYLRAMMKEVLRWRPVNKAGMMHASSEEDWYRGWFIPKGSVVMLNWWAIHMDPSLHPSPTIFSPSRYLNSPLSSAQYMTSADPSARDHFSFGAGRRACPGVHVAERSMFINMARVLWGFSIRKKIGKDGKEVPVSDKMMPGFFSVPEPFEADIRPRSEAHARVMREEGERAEREGLRH